MSPHETAQSEGVAPTKRRRDDEGPMTRDEIVRIVIESNRRRSRWRRLLRIILIPVTIVALVFVTKLFSMYAFAHFSITAHLSGDSIGTVTAAEGQLPANWFTPYAAPYNIGVGLATGDKLPESRKRFEEALGLAQGLEVCAVRFNLSLVIETQGDKAAADQKPDEAEKLYAEALDVLAQAPAECNSDAASESSPDSSRDMGKDYEESQQRQSEKQQQQQEQQKPDKPQDDPSDQPTPSPSPSEDPQPSQDKLDKVKKMLEQGNKERDDAQDGDDSSSGGADKPW